MRSAARRGRRLIGSIVVLASVVTVSADCVFGARMTAAQLACCAAMDADCGGMAEARACCSIESHRADGFTPAARAGVPRDAAVWLVAVLPALAGVSTGQHFPSRFNGFLFQPPGVPTYLRLSAFLV
ncbi:MAG: hypothetical protein HY824_02285 [Acidobacteria bacterium]|nr:hypothetical protein [Acidobacteriota bacterium]